MKNWFLIIILLFVANQVFAQDGWVISGYIKDTAGIPVEQANIKVLNANISAISDKNGFFTISFPDSKGNIISISGMNFQKQEIYIDRIWDGKRISITIVNRDLQIEEVVISDYKTRESGLVKIEPKLLNNIPNFGGDNIQALVKTLPGVASGNELSSNYSVRGGNFDENLVYINGIEIFRPLLLQSGEQEGLSMANPDMVSKIDFSSGGFSAIYDDKMSSVLDIKYRQPTDFNAGATVSLLGASAYLEGCHFNKKFSHLSGFRYKNSQYLLKSLETKGEYKPNFTDIQTLLSYDISKGLSINILGYYANNNYLFLPEDRTTTFGSISDPLGLYIDFEGNERDNYTSSLGALTMDYRISDKLGMKWTAGIYDTYESLTYDIVGSYSLNELDKQEGSSSYGDSILNLGIGEYLDHARSYFQSRIYSFAYSASLNSANSLFRWGLKYQHEIYNDQVNEWKMIDSAGYSLPNRVDELTLSESWYSDNMQISNHLSAYFHSTYQNPGIHKWNIDYGIRYALSDLNLEHLVSPRLAIGWYPKQNKKLYLRIGGGLYYQSIVFREIIDRNGNIHPETKTPFSVHCIISGDYDFSMMGRPFHLKTELYYKSLKRLIPYSVDNIKNLYYPGQRGHGYASGIDFRLNGEFVPDVESWLSVSFMKSGIDIEGDTMGEQPLPNDHVVNVSLYFQDYIPGNKRFKMYLALFYLTGRPFGPPNNDTYYAPGRITAYKRVDIGFSANLKSEEKTQQGIGKYFKQVMLHFELFNILGITNNVSYNWVNIVPNSSVVGQEKYSSVSVPNRLSARRLNLRLVLSF